MRSLETRWTRGPAAGSVPALRLSRRRQEFQGRAPGRRRSVRRRSHHRVGRTSSRCCAQRRWHRAQGPVRVESKRSGSPGRFRDQPTAATASRHSRHRFGSATQCLRSGQTPGSRRADSLGQFDNYQPEYGSTHCLDTAVFRSTRVLATTNATLAASPVAVPSLQGGKISGRARFCSRMSGTQAGRRCRTTPSTI